jgi:hypothetical protein
MQKFKLNIIEKQQLKNKNKALKIAKNVFYIFTLFLSSLFLGVLFLELLTRI